MENGKVFRGELHCTKCHQEGGRGGRFCTQLYRREDGAYEALCFRHKPDDGYDRLAMLEKCFHIPWRDVSKLVLHKTDPVAHDRSGEVITIIMRNVPNVELMRAHAIEVAHGLQLMSDTQATIHQWTEGTEQNYCWTDNNYSWEAPATAVIRDKYWGKRRISDFHEVCRMMCQVHEWELEDETMPLLDRIVHALDKSDKEDEA